VSTIALDDRLEAEEIVSKIATNTWLDHDLVTSNSLRSFEHAKESIGPSTKAKSLKGWEIVEEEDTLIADPEEISLESYGTGSDLTEASGLDVMIGSQISCTPDTMHQRPGVPLGLCASTARTCAVRGVSPLPVRA